MKLSVSLLALAASASGHTIFQKVSVNGADQGQLKGVRAPSSDSPIQNVNDGAFACNKGLQYKDNTIINIPAGAKVGAWWGHVIGGAQGANDRDHPIAASHKGKGRHVCCGMHLESGCDAIPDLRARAMGPRLNRACSSWPRDWLSNLHPISGSLTRCSNICEV